METTVQFSIPPGLTDLLEEFVVKCIQENPSDLVDFAADYFNMLRLGRKKKDSKAGKESTASKPEKKECVEDKDEVQEPPKMPARGRRRAVAAEAYNPNENDASAKPVVHPKTDEQLQRLKKSVENILLFKSCDREQMKELLDAMFERKVSPEDEIIRQGADGDNFYVIDNGVFDVFIEKDGKEVKVHTFKDAGSFGELALMYNCPRNATIIAKSQGSIWALDQATFRRIVVGAAARKRQMYEALLENVPMLAQLQAYERMNLADALETKIFEEGQCIIRQNDEADCMYFIEQGTVRVTVSGKEISHLKKGAYFGEVALVTKNPRSASVFADGGEVKCACLNVDAFERLLGPCMDIMKRNIAHYEEQRKALGLDS